MFREWSRGWIRTHSEAAEGGYGTRLVGVRQLKIQVSAAHSANHHHLNKLNIALLYTPYPKFTTSPFNHPQTTRSELHKFYHSQVGFVCQQSSSFKIYWNWIIYK
ncbi:hypothetical protein L1987_33768 [Smallanthus sonchifolius]|uniref:Uncharacterized protein n=1 Tax=Smallanthus sonchifolius TaxID=185202 RepID=A0ACB9HTE3_9ASTR|nr:hypothetical protein L1987_33768 [Smallanthus sonchifolius]